MSEFVIREDPFGEVEGGRNSIVRDDKREYIPVVEAKANHRSGVTKLPITKLSGTVQDS